MNDQKLVGTVQMDQVRGAMLVRGDGSAPVSLPELLSLYHGHRVEIEIKLSPDFSTLQWSAGAAS